MSHLGRDRSFNLSSQLSELLIAGGSWLVSWKGSSIHEASARCVLEANLTAENVLETHLDSEGKYSQR